MPLDRNVPAVSQSIHTTEDKRTKSNSSSWNKHLNREPAQGNNPDEFPSQNRLLFIYSTKVQAVCGSLKPKLRNAVVGLKSSQYIAHQSVYYPVAC